MEHRLDVSALEPPEPLEQILDTIPRLGPGDYLHVLHRREPHLLYPMLKQAGFAWWTRPGRAFAFEIFIWHRDDHAAKAAIFGHDAAHPAC